MAARRGRWRRTMGGYQVSGHGPGDDGYDEEGYDESQRAEILETTRTGPSDGTIMVDLDPDLGDDDDTDEEDDLLMADDEIGEESDDYRERSDENTSELQSLMHISYAVFCLKKKKNKMTKRTKKQNKHEE